LIVIERVFKFWLPDPAARARRIRGVRGCEFQSLESRIALSVSPQFALSPVFGSPAGYVSSQSALVQPFPARDWLDQSRAFNSNQQRVTANSDATAPVTLAGSGRAQIGIDPIIAAVMGAEAGNPGSKPTSPANPSGPVAQPTSGESGAAAD